MGSLLKTCWLLFRSARPRQWTKNLAVFAAIIFTGQFLNPALLFLSLKTFIVFCLVASSAYLINDLVDYPQDRLHPFKRRRPIASGELDKKTALVTAILTILAALEFSFLNSGVLFFIALTFLILQLSYTFFFKRIPQADILVIASAYILRVYAGELVTGYHLSIWLMLSVISLSLFLATGKRRAEITLLTGGETDKPIPPTRATLLHYRRELLNIYTSVFATSTFITYGFFTFTEGVTPAKEGVIFQFFLRFAPAWIERKWLMITIPFVLYGIMRYLQLIYEKGEGESPERVLFSDWPLLSAVFSWALLVILIIYFF